MTIQDKRHPVSDMLAITMANGSTSWCTKVPIILVILFGNWTDNFAHMVYIDWSEFKLRYATNSNGWVSHIVDPEAFELITQISR